MQKRKIRPSARGLLVFIPRRSSRRLSEARRRRKIFQLRELEKSLALAMASSSSAAAAEGPAAVSRARKRPRDSDPEEIGVGKETTPALRCDCGRGGFYASADIAYKLHILGAPPGTTHRLMPVKLVFFPPEEPEDETSGPVLRRVVSCVCSQANVYYSRRHAKDAHSDCELERPQFVAYDAYAPVSTPGAGDPSPKRPHRLELDGGGGGGGGSAAVEKGEIPQNGATVGVSTLSIFKDAYSDAKAQFPQILPKKIYDYLRTRNDYLQSQAKRSIDNHRHDPDHYGAAECRNIYCRMGFTRIETVDRRFVASAVTDPDAYKELLLAYLGAWTSEHTQQPSSPNRGDDTDDPGPAASSESDTEAEPESGAEAARTDPPPIEIGAQEPRRPVSVNDIVEQTILDMAEEYPEIRTSAIRRYLSSARTNLCYIMRKHINTRHHIYITQKSGPGRCFATDLCRMGLDPGEKVSKDKYAVVRDPDAFRSRLLQNFDAWAARKIKASSAKKEASRAGAQDPGAET